MPKCKVCKGEAFLVVGIFSFCSHDHAYEFAISKMKKDKQKKEKQFRSETAKMKKSIKTRSEHLKEAQAEFNRFIRLRDAELPCISCGKPNDGSHQRHASHYKSRGAFPELAFNELNCHASCSQCNNFLSGNLVPYRAALIKKIGLDRVEWLEGPNEPLKLTIEQIKAIKQEYRNKCKAITHPTTSP